MKRKIFFYFLFILAPVLAQAQQQIEGKVTNENGVPVMNAFISLLNSSDSSLIQTTTTDNNGNYKLSTATTTGIVRSEAAGYIAAFKNWNTAEAIMDFKLAPVKALSEVTITQKKPVVEQKADRTIFNVENSIVALGGDALEALKKVPGVQVMQNQIIIAGKGSVGVMLNGRMQQLGGEELIQFFRSIPANNLSKIELITSPGARHDAEGNSGIINLVTKKNMTDGFRGSLTGTLTRNHYNSPSGSTSLQYRKGKLNLYSNDNASVWNWVYTSRTTLYYPNQRWEQAVDQEYSNKNARAQIGADYTIGKNTIIGILYSKGFGGSDNKEHIRSNGFEMNTIPDSSIRTEGRTHEVFKRKHTLNLNYEWKIDSMGKKLNVDADYFTQSTERERNFTVNNYFSDGTSMNEGSENKIISNPAITIRSAKADLELPYSFAHFSLGVKASFVDNKGDFVYQEKTGNDYKIDSSRSNRFLYEEQIQAAYINAQKKIGKLDMQAGLRLERTETNGYTPATGETNKRDYTKLFPSMNLQYQLNEKQSLGFTYARRINRPGYNFLNPFRFYYTPNSYTEGNPNLQPSINNVLELSWFLGSKYYLRLRTNQIDNYWERLFFTDSSTGTSSLTRANVGKGAYYGLSFGFSYSITKWWDFRGNISGEYSEFRLRSYGQETFHSGCNGWIEFGNSFALNKNKTLLAELNGYYYTPRQKDYKRWGEMSNFEGGIKALFLNKNLIVGVNFEDPFAKAYWYQTNSMNGTTEYSYDDGRLISFTATYKFGNKNLKGKRERNTTTEEMQRAN